MTTETADGTPARAGAAEPGSLASRMRARRDQIEAQTTEKFDIPGYEGVLAAEYRVLSWKQIRGIQTRHDKERDPALQEIYSAADTLIFACEEIYEVLADGTHQPTGERWRELARRAGANLPEDATQRQALLALFVHDARVMDHYREYERWLRGVDGEPGAASDVDDEVMRDFGRTGSPT